MFVGNTKVCLSFERRGKKQTETISKLVVEEDLPFFTEKKRYLFKPSVDWPKIADKQTLYLQSPAKDTLCVEETFCCAAKHPEK